MALPKYSQPEQTTPTTYPQAGWQGLFFDSADGKLKRIDDAGTVVSIEDISGPVGLDQGGTGADLSSGQGVLVQSTSGAVVSSLGGTGILKLTSDVPSVASLAAADLPTGTLKTDAAISGTLQAVEDASGNASGLKIGKTGVIIEPTASTSTPLQIKNDGAAYMNIYAYRNNVYGGGLAFLHARGTMSSPSSLNDDDISGLLTLNAHNGTDFEGTFAIASRYYSSGHQTKIGTTRTDVVLTIGQSNKLGFFDTTPISKPTVSGSRGGNAALASLCTALAGLGLITDSTT
jgi:hypothetical protein